MCACRRAPRRAGACERRPRAGRVVPRCAAPAGRQGRRGCAAGPGLCRRPPPAAARPGGPFAEMQMARMQREGMRRSVFHSKRKQIAGMHRRGEGDGGAPRRRRGGGARAILASPGRGVQTRLGGWGCLAVTKGRSGRHSGKCIRKGNGRCCRPGVPGAAGAPAGAAPRGRAARPAARRGGGALVSGGRGPRRARAAPRPAAPPRRAPAAFRAAWLLAAARRGAGALSLLLALALALAHGRLAGALHGALHGRQPGLALDGRRRLGVGGRGAGAGGGRLGGGGGGRRGGCGRRGGGGLLLGGLLGGRRLLGRRLGGGFRASVGAGRRMV